MTQHTPPRPRREESMYDDYSGQDNTPKQSTRDLMNMMAQHSMSDTQRNTVIEKQMVKCVPMYDGTPEKFQSWADALQVTGEFHNYDLVNMVPLIKLHSTANVHNIIANMEASDWMDLLMQLRRKFSDCPSIFAAQAKLQQFRQITRSVIQYNAEFLRLAREAGCEHEKGTLVYYI